LLGDYREPPFTRSELERRFVDLCRAAGLPVPSTNIWIVTGEVDAAWPDRRLVVELDGCHHRTAAAFERDRERDAQLQLAGYRVLRVTARRLERDPEGVVATVTALLG
jgi:very-short-patch-repair endonuclease